MGPQKLHFFYLVFFEKSGLEWMLISPIFSSFVSYNANQTRETAMSTQFPSFFFFFFFSNEALVMIIIIIIIIIISLYHYEYDEWNLIIYNKLY